MTIGRSTVESLRRRLNIVRAADRVIKFLVDLKERTVRRCMTKGGQYLSTSHIRWWCQLYKRVNQHLTNRIKRKSERIDPRKQHWMMAVQA